MLAIPKGKMPRRSPAVDGVRRISDPHHPRGYRDICSPSAWERRRRFIAERAGDACHRCGRHCAYPDGDAHHEGGRGLGGGKRDDSVEGLEWLCRMCHRGVVHVPAKVLPSKKGL
jgi:hypothetical protein